MAYFASAVALLLAALPLQAAGAGPRPEPASGPPADFKLVVRLFGARKAPLAKAEVVVVRGVAYQFITDSPDEVMVIDPVRSRVQLLDLGRLERTEVTALELDAALGRIHRKATAAVERKEKAGGRANAVSAEMTRNLIDPRLARSFDPAARRLRLTNPTVEIDAEGTPEDDPARLYVVVNCLAAVAKLAALREPDNVPPFARLDALRALASDHLLRPTGVSVLYRMAGPPKRLRWTYDLVPALTDREREAIRQVDQMLARARALPFDAYENAGAN